MLTVNLIKINLPYLATLMLSCEVIFFASNLIETFPESTSIELNRWELYSLNLHLLDYVDRKNQSPPNY